ncbi:MAG: hypothetical protein JO015_04135 [Verrucomicrobia bacterium]|nr:hypothetical protein [Verrucomicrobiota bacterium]
MKHEENGSWRGFRRHVGREVPEGLFGRGDVHAPGNGCITVRQGRLEFVYERLQVRRQPGAG